MPDDTAADAAPAPTPAPAQDSTTQAVTALAIIAAMTVLGGGLLLCAYAMHDKEIAIGGIATIIGALATALQTPSGISKVIAAATAGAKRQAP